MTNDVLHQKRLRAGLENELARRIERNPHYSLRAFAASLEVSHTLLSLILSGRRRISGPLRSRLQENGVISDSLAFPEEEPSKNALTDGLPTSEDFQQISLDTFSVISDWYHYAILSLFELPGAKVQSSWVARKLRITPAEARLAIARLKRLGLLTQTNGRWKQSGHSLKVENKKSTAATRKFNRELLKKAEESLERDPFDSRDFSSMTFSMDPKWVGLARERIKMFRRRLVRELEQLGKPSVVYQLSVQVFPLSQLEDKKNQLRSQR